MKTFKDFLNTELNESTVTVDAMLDDDYTIKDFQADLKKAGITIAKKKKSRHNDDVTEVTLKGDKAKLAAWLKSNGYEDNVSDINESTVTVDAMFDDDDYTIKDFQADLKKARIKITKKKKSKYDDDVIEVTLSGDKAKLEAWLKKNGYEDNVSDIK